MTNVAIITGVAGQDGSYLAESLLRKGYEVHGLIRPTTRNEIDNLVVAERSPRFHKHEIDLLETEALTRLIRKHSPDEYYNLAACSFVPASWDLPDYVTRVNALVPLRILEAIRAHSPETRFYQAGSSEMFGNVLDRSVPLHEHSYHYPRSPYGATKSFAHNITRNYRESHGLHATNGILFNHESERRDPRFVTRKITRGLAVWCNNRAPLKMGNLDAVRDWGYSPDYVEAMQLMVRNETADDWCVATGKAHSVRDFIRFACENLGFDIQWEGEGVKERGFDEHGETVVEIDPAFYRPAEVEFLRGDSSKIRRYLGWSEKTTFPDMVRLMMENDLRQVRVLA